MIKYAASVVTLREMSLELKQKAQQLDGFRSELVGVSSELEALEEESAGDPLAASAKAVAARVKERGLDVSRALIRAALRHADGAEESALELIDALPAAKRALGFFARPALVVSDAAGADPTTVSLLLACGLEEPSSVSITTARAVEQRLKAPALASFVEARAKADASSDDAAAAAATAGLTRTEVALAACADAVVKYAKAFERLTPARQALEWSERRLRDKQAEVDAKAEAKRVKLHARAMALGGFELGLERAWSVGSRVSVMSRGTLHACRVMEVLTEGGDGGGDGVKPSAVRVRRDADAKIVTVAPSKVRAADAASVAELAKAFSWAGFPWIGRKAGAECEDELHQAIGLRELPRLRRLLGKASELELDARSSTAVFAASELCELLEAEGATRRAARPRLARDVATAPRRRRLATTTTTTTRRRRRPRSAAWSRAIGAPLTAALDVFLEEVDTTVAAGVPVAQPFGEAAGATSSPCSCARPTTRACDDVLAAVRNAAGVLDIETEQCCEQEQEREQAEQEQEIEMERYVDAAYQRDGEEPKRWAIASLAWGGAPRALDELRAAAPQFYAQSDFKLYGRAALPFPEYCALSTNRFDRTWVGARRLKNATIVLEWLPSTARLDDAGAARRDAAPTPDALSADQDARLARALALLDTGAAAGRFDRAAVRESRRRPRTSSRPTTSSTCSCAATAPAATRRRAPTLSELRALLVKG